MNVIDTNEFPMDHEQFIGWYNRRGGKESFESKDAIEADHAAALKIERLRNRPTQGFGIRFPYGMEATPCKTRTFSLVIPKMPRHRGTRYGAVRIVTVFPNRPTVTAPRIGLPGFYTKWAD